MADPMPPDVQAMLDHAWQTTQRLAVHVIEYPPAQRDEVMWCMGSLFAEIAREAGCTHETAQEFGDAMEQAVRDFVAEIQASGGGVPGTA
jgi:hypothetical protein